MFERRRRFLAAVSCAGVLPVRVHAQSGFPAGPVKIVVAFPAGGGADVLARTLGKLLSERWDKPVVIENRPGAATAIAAGAVARAAPDGLTLLLTSDTTLGINPVLYPKLPYDAASDFAPVAQLVQLNQMLLTRKERGFTDLKSLISYAMRNPAKLTYASYGSGSEPHLAMEMFKSLTRIFVLHIPYRGVPNALSALLAGDVDITFSGVASALPHIQSGKLHPLAIGGARRSALVSDVPTFSELGYAAVPARAWFGLLAPAGTPAATINKIAQDIRVVSSSPDFLAKDVLARGLEPIFSLPADFSREIARQRVEAVELVKVSRALPE